VVSFTPEQFFGKILATFTSVLGHMMKTDPAFLESMTSGEASKESLKAMTMSIGCHKKKKKKKNR
jgi:hypothetical protein